VQIKTGTHDPSFSRKGSDSLSPELVEFLEEGIDFLVEGTD